MDHSLMDWYFGFRIAAALESRPNELYFRSVYLPRLKAIYLPNPKVAGSTVMATLIKADGSPHLMSIENHNDHNARRLMSAKHDPRAFWRALQDPEFFRFAFVRNPYTRIVSAYLDKIVTGSRRKLDIKADATLLDFLQTISTQKPRKMNRHWRPQSALISPKVKLDFLGRFERFNDDFSEVLDRLGVDSTAIREMRAHQTSANNRLDLIGVEEKALIDRIYRDDFERFGYSKEL